MSKIAVHQAESGKAAVANPFFAKVEKALEAVRKRAFELFEKRGRTPGRDLEDWLQAERELFYIPETGLTEGDNSFTVTIRAPGFEAKDVEVIVLPREILVEAKADRREPTAVESKCFYRHFELGAPIETGKVHATLDCGQLTIEAPKKMLRMIPVRAATA